MRNIEFRGIGSKTGNFIYGYYASDNKGYHGIISHNPSDDSEMLSNHVDAKTVGQFTGLLDKNGTKIFEGDIVETSSGVTGEVVYDDCIGFIISGRSIYELGSDQSDRLFEVIGNIHEEN